MYVERNDSFDEMLNDCYPPMVIGAYTFYAADILADCDPIAYRCAVADYESELEEDSE